jgi:serine/threonine protein kinase
VEVVVVRKKPTIGQKLRGYWQPPQAQDSQLFVRKLYLLGNVSTGPNIQAEKYLRREYDILRKINHPHIVRCADLEVIHSSAEGIKAYLYMPYCVFGDLSCYTSAWQKAWASRVTLSTNQFWQIFRQLASALLYCQTGVLAYGEKNFAIGREWSRPIFHRDIKPGNGNSTCVLQML